MFWLQLTCFFLKVSSCSTCQTIKDVQTCVGKHKLACVNVGPTVGKHVDKLFGKLEVHGQNSEGKCDT